MFIDGELFYLPDLAHAENTVLLPEMESRHMGRVLRKRVGERVYLTDGRGWLGRAQIVAVEGGRVRCLLEEKEKQPEPASRRIQVALAMIRPNRLDWAVEKLTELGVGRITLLQSNYAQPHSYKPRHLENISIAALKQSRQTYLPELEPPLPLSRWLASQPGGSGTLRLVGDVAGQPLARSFEAARGPVVFLVGPEGGFSTGEQQAIAGRAFQPVRIAHAILRSETAAVSGTAQLLMCLLSNRLTNLS